MTIIREMLLTSSYDFTHHTEKKVLTIDRKNCLPSSEKTAYRGQKKVLTADRKNSLPNDGKIILPRAFVFEAASFVTACCVSSGLFEVSVSFALSACIV